jgi:hypothetical protein
MVQNEFQFFGFLNFGFVYELRTLYYTDLIRSYYIDRRIISILQNHTISEICFTLSNAEQEWEPWLEPGPEPGPEAQGAASVLLPQPEPHQNVFFFQVITAR